jgi:hypothetical protein
LLRMARNAPCIHPHADPAMMTTRLTGPQKDAVWQKDALPSCLWPCFFWSIMHDICKHHLFKKTVLFHRAVHDTCIFHWFRNILLQLFLLKS